jgi:hypothetical protein
MRPPTPSRRRRRTRRWGYAADPEECVMPERSDYNSGTSVTGGAIAGPTVSAGAVFGHVTVSASSEALENSSWDLHTVEFLVRALSEGAPLEAERILRVLREVWPPEEPTTLEELTDALAGFVTKLRHEFRRSSDKQFVEKLRQALLQVIVKERGSTREPTRDVPVSIYVDDESAGPGLELAVGALLTELGMQVTQADLPIQRSWFRRLRARSKLMTNSPEYVELMTKATRALELHALDRPQAEVDAGQGDAAAKIITALGASKIRNAVVQVGSILAVKVGDEITVRTLSQLELACLARRPDLLRSPAEALVALRMETERATASLPAAQTARSGQ